MSENEKNHRKMWRWLAEQTRKKKRRVRKWEYFEALDIPYEKRIAGYCYACEEARLRADKIPSDLVCDSCPINWGEGACMREGSLYAEWGNTDEQHYERAAELAEQIAQLEWRDKDAR